MSNQDSKLGGTDWWIMEGDGTRKQRLSYFNDPAHPESNGHAVWAGTVPAENWSREGHWFLGDVETNLFTTAGEIRRMHLTCR
jgi:hypothetical protein